MDLGPLPALTEKDVDRMSVAGLSELRPQAGRPEKAPLPLYPVFEEIYQMELYRKAQRMMFRRHVWGRVLQLVGLR